MEDWKLEPARDLNLPLGKRLRSEKREGGLVGTLAQISARTLVRIYLKLWHRVEHKGLENLPQQGPFVLSANHCSHLDSVVMAAMLPWRLRKNTFPLAAGDVFFETPILTTLAAVVINALPMWRKNVGRHALDDLRQRLVDHGASYILFPEGRRSEDGKILTFKAGVGMLTAGTKAQVVPCYIQGAHEALARSTFIPRFRKITIFVGKPIPCEPFPNTREGWKALVHEVEKSIRSLGGLPPPMAATGEPPGAPTQPA
jgi:1-acyl-sn-glycerol-3-phosphate acyltransferase